MGGGTLILNSIRQRLSRLPLSLAPDLIHNGLFEQHGLTVIVRPILRSGEESGLAQRTVALRLST